MLKAKPKQPTKPPGKPSDAQNKAQPPLPGSGAADHDAGPPAKAAK
ncbi:MAG: hypothetical protein TU35_003330 [Thermoproteus sp. AZ2]|uniref:Uncharacterized protein n=1 Tax=Thermoproteus sp. AZ2 TaxID=1609232 RepID=A0ACC6UZM5_9CREN